MIPHDVLSTLPRWLPPLAGGAGLAMLAFSIHGLLRLVRTPALARVPLGAEQEVDLDVSGPILLSVEGPLLSTLFRGTFTLHDRLSREDVPLSSVVLRTRTTGFGWARLVIARFVLDRPRHLTLVTGGVPPGTEAARHTVVFTRPLGAKLPAYVLGCIVSAMLLVGGLVFTILLHAG